MMSSSKEKSTERSKKMIPSNLIPSFLLYCFISAITPGPANLCSLASAVKYGRKQALHQWRGIFFGFGVVAFAASLAVWFLGTVLHQWLNILSLIGAGYIFWLAWQIAQSSGTKAEAGVRCNFYTGMLVQLTNPKIMIFCVTALTTYVLPYAENYWELLSIAVLLPFTGPIANLVWLFSGSMLQRFFQNYQRTINNVMAMLLVLCAVSIIQG